MIRGNTPLGHHTDRGPMGLGQYNSLGEYCGPHTASSEFLILIIMTKGACPLFRPKPFNLKLA